MCKPFSHHADRGGADGRCRPRPRPGAKAVPAEALLSADCVLFVRHDGYEPHRQAYDKTTLARLMKDDLGEFLEYLGTYGRDLAIRNLLQQGDGKPAVDKDKAISDTRKFVDYFKRHGLAVGFEVGEDLQRQSRDGALPQVDPAGVQTTIVFPQGGLPGESPRRVRLSHLLSRMADLEIVEKKERGRTFFLARERPLSWPCSSGGKRGTTSSCASAPGPSRVPST